MNRICSVFAVILFLEFSTGVSAELPEGKTSDWKGFERIDFTLHERPAIIVKPKEVASGKPWIWRARFFGHRPEADLALLENGYHLVYCDVANLFGSPQAVEHWNRCYKTITTKYEFNSKPVLEGMSRGGLIVFNWLAANPDKASCLYLDAPVCDFKSWPGGFGKGVGSPVWRTLLDAYGFKNDIAVRGWRGNPVDHADKLAKLGIPMFVVTGDADDVVPKEENIDLILTAWKKHNAPLEVVVKPGVGHKHGLDDPQPLIDFLLKHSTPTK